MFSRAIITYIVMIDFCCFRFLVSARFFYCHLIQQVQGFGIIGAEAFNGLHVSAEPFGSFSLEELGEARETTAGGTGESKSEARRQTPEAGTNSYFGEETESKSP